jgi:hypothetical protein
MGVQVGIAALYAKHIWVCLTGAWVCTHVRDTPTTASEHCATRWGAPVCRDAWKGASVSASVLLPTFTPYMFGLFAHTDTHTNAHHTRLASGSYQDHPTTSCAYGPAAMSRSHTGDAGCVAGTRTSSTTSSIGATLIRGPRASEPDKLPTGTPKLKSGTARKRKPTGSPRASPRRIKFCVRVGVTRMEGKGAFEVDKCVRVLELKKAIWERWLNHVPLSWVRISAWRGQAHWKLDDQATFKDALQRTGDSLRVVINATASCPDEPARGDV